MTTRTQAKPLFAATLTPQRSLTLGGKRILMVLISALAAIPGLAFFSLGAWPIAGFMGLDVLAIWLALTLSMRAGKASEQITLWPTKLEINRIDATGHAEKLSFDPRLVRMVIDRDMNERTMALWLRSGDERLQLGAFLSPDDRASFSKVFGTALRKARA